MKYEDLKPDAPPPLPPEKRARIVEQVLRSQNSGRQFIAKEIETGDLYTNERDQSGWTYLLWCEPDSWRLLVSGSFEECLGLFSITRQ
jgi:hypothetical protein